MMVKKRFALMLLKYELSFFREDELEDDFDEWHRDR